MPTEQKFFFQHEQWSANFNTHYNRYRHWSNTITYFFYLIAINHSRMQNETKVSHNDFIITNMNHLSATKSALIKETQERFPQVWQILSAPDQTEHMRFLVKATKSRKGIEVGVFTGYSALCMAEGLPEDGKLIALDINEEFTNVGLKYWKEAGVDHKIDLRLGPGVDSLNKLLEDPNEVGTYDFAYIDADKLNYPNYYELLVKLLRPGGFIMFDNILWGRRVEHEELRTKDPETRAIYETILRAMKDERVDTHTINLADGFMISYKK